MKNYYDLFVHLSLQQCFKDDYADKRKVKQHNEASQKIAMLQQYLCNTDCSELLHKLLLYPDNRVKINASLLCVEKENHVEQAIRTLEYIINSEKDETICFSAKMILLKANNARK